MELHERIKQIRREKKISRKDLSLRLSAIFGDKAIKSNTVWRIESGLTTARLSSLQQISAGLGVGLRDILAQIQPKSKLVQLTRKTQRMESFSYNPGAKAEVLTPAGLDFLIQELTISPGSSTQTEEDPIESGKFHKWIFCLSGKLACNIGSEKHNLTKDDCLSFESHIPHSFANETSRKCRCLIVQYPKHI